jgi:hypothetical protein
LYELLFSGPEIHHGRISRGGHGLLKVSLGQPTPYAYEIHLLANLTAFVGSVEVMFVMNDGISWSHDPIEAVLEDRLGINSTIKRTING